MAIEAFEARAKAFDTVQSFGLVIRPLDNTFHVGILYKVGERPAQIYHLAWHHRVVHETPDESYFWIQSGLKSDTIRAMAIGVERLAKRLATKIPYSPDYDGSAYFKPGTLRYLRTGAGEGLTCATFILAIHQAFAIKLLDISTWPAKRDSDQAWKEHVIKTLREHPQGDANIEAHVVGIEKNPSAVRFRPEEVAVGVGISDHPVAFADAEAAGKDLAKRLRGSRIIAATIGASSEHTRA